MSAAILYSTVWYIREETRRKLNNVTTEVHAETLPSPLLSGR